MKLVILQPGYLPWLGFFDQMNWADVFVIYDDVQYTKNDWRNRNQIKTANGAVWLTVPIQFHLGRVIKDIKLSENYNWAKSHVKSILYSYAKAKYFNQYFPKIKDIIETKYGYLIELNMALTTYLNQVLGIQTKIIHSSSLNIKGERTERLINICREFEATDYLTGDAAKNYLDIDLFKKNHINVKYQNYKHPVYTQLWGDFIPYLSVIDLLFNCGPESLNILSKTKE